MDVLDDPAQTLGLDRPRAEDGAAVHDLIARCPPLDPNSRYCNLLQCLHFADTCAIARRDDAVVGFLSAYVPPDRPDTLFVWQVAVDESARGQGLAGRLLAEVLARSRPVPITRIEATITEDNRASWALFEGIARKCGAELRRAPLFDRDVHFGGRHDSEILISIGPIRANPFQSRKESTDE